MKGIAFQENNENIKKIIIQMEPIKPPKRIIKKQHLNQGDYTK